MYSFTQAGALYITPVYQYSAEPTHMTHPQRLTASGADTHTLCAIDFHAQGAPTPLGYSLRHADADASPCRHAHAELLPVAARAEVVLVIAYNQLPPSAIAPAP
jgi:hypothetical protein